MTTPTPEAIELAIEAIRLTIGHTPRDTRPEALLAADLLLDSMALVRLACEIEDSLDTPVSDADLADWQTLADVARTIEAAQSRRAA